MSRKEVKLGGKTDMKIAMLVLPVLVGIVAVALLAAGQSVQGQQGQEEVKVASSPTTATVETVEGFQLSVHTDKDTFAPTEAVVFVLSLKNVTTEPLSFIATTPESDFSMTVKDKEGQNMPFTRYGKGMNTGAIFARYSVEVKGGEQKQYKLQLDRIYDMTASGTYSVTVKRKVPKRKGGGFAELTSNTIKVKVRDSAPDDLEEGTRTPGEATRDETP